MELKLSMIYKNQRIIEGIKKDKNTRIKKRETPAPCEAYELNEHLNKSIKHSVSGRAYSGSSEAT